MGYDTGRAGTRANMGEMEPIDPDQDHDPSASGMTDAQKWILGGVAGAALILFAIVAVLSLDDGGDGDRAADVTSTTTSSTSTTSTSTSTTEPMPSVDPYAVAYPPPSSDIPAADPVDVARRYATDMLGFDDLSVGEFEAGDARAGEVTISDGTGGPTTTVVVRQMEDDRWYVLGSETENIVVTAPTAGTGLGSPFETRGRALAFEGTVDVVVRELDDGSQMGSGFVTGSGTPPAGPFDGQIFFGTPRQDVAGVLVYRTLSARDGHVEAATSFPVRLTPRSTPSAAVDCGSPATGRDDGEDPTDVKVVKVYFHCDGELLPVRRTVPADDPAVLTASMRHLVAGPDNAEVTVGYTSVFTMEDAVVNRVAITDGVAIIDLGGVADGLESTPENVRTLIDEVVATATQYSTVSGVEIHFDGSCQAFRTWSDNPDTCRVHP